MSVKRVGGQLAAIVVLIAVGVSLVTAQANQTASEFYTAYRAAFDKAKKIEELIPYMSKSMKADIEKTPTSERPTMFEMIKEMSKMSDVKIVKETKTADGVTLSVEAVGPERGKMTGQVRIVKEDGAWKMAKESWSSKG
jgi:hypothetical protein